jgi:predicted Zn-dependent peptidase
MNDDDPGDTVHEAFTAQLFGDTPLGRPVLGTVGSINSITRDQIWEHYAARYTAPHLVVAAAGNLDHDAVVARVRAAFKDALEVTSGEAPAAPRLRKSDGVLRAEAGVPADRAGQPGARL